MTPYSMDLRTRVLRDWDRDGLDPAAAANALADADLGAAPGGARGVDSGATSQVRFVAVPGVHP
jgi:hypothetical protein